VSLLFQYQRALHCRLPVPTPAEHLPYIKLFLLLYYFCSNQQKCRADNNLINSRHKKVMKELPLVVSHKDIWGDGGVTPFILTLGTE
jgi:hypothetical protein